MRIVFMGTPALAATILEGLASKHDVVGVFTRPDAVRGRGKKFLPSDVKALAERLGIPCYTPPDMKGNEPAALLEELAPDAVCVSAYGVLLPARVLTIPRLGCLNVHTSLLPRWRGAAPIQRAILEGDEKTGVCIMRMEEGLDTGPYCTRREIELHDETAGELTRKLASLGVEALLEALDAVESGTVRWTSQSNDDATYAKKIEKGELNPSPDDDARLFVAKVKASDGAHPARAVIAGRSLAIEQASIVADEQGLSAAGTLEPGEAVFRAKRLFVGAKDAVVEIKQVRPDGKKSMEARAFAGGIQGVKTASIRLERC